MDKVDFFFVVAVAFLGALVFFVLHYDKISKKKRVQYRKSEMDRMIKDEFSKGGFEEDRRFFQVLSVSKENRTFIYWNDNDKLTLGDFDDIDFIKPELKINKINGKCIFLELTLHLKNKIEIEIGSNSLAEMFDSVEYLRAIAGKSILKSYDGFPD